MRFSIFINRIILLGLSILILHCGAVYSEVQCEALTDPIEIDEPCRLQCTISNGSRSDKNFRWFKNGFVVKADLPNQTDSVYEIKHFSEEYLVNSSIECSYDFNTCSFDASIFRRNFLYYPDNRSMSYTYIHDNNSVRLEVMFPKVYPLPSCSLLGKEMNPEFSMIDWFYSGSYREEWPVKLFRCSNLQPDCYLIGAPVPNGPIKTDCDEALNQLDWNILIPLVLYVVVMCCILVCIFKFRKEDGRRREFLWEGKRTKIQYLSAFSSLIGNPFLYGYNIAVLNNPAVIIAMSVMPKDETDVSEMSIIKQFNESLEFNFLWSLGVGLFIFAGFFGVLSASGIARRFGRKRPLMLNSMVMIVASIFGLCIQHVPINYKRYFFYLHRVVIGFSCGLGLIISGVYNMEISRLTVNAIKGSYGTYNRWFQYYITLGIAVASFFGLSSILGNREWWYFLLLFNAIPAACNLLLVFCPESPIFVYVKTNDLKWMEDELRKICTDEELNDKIETVKREASRLSDFDSSKYTTVRQLIKECRRDVIVACFLQAAQQLSGINIVMAYSSFIYQNSGVHFELSEWIVFGTSLINCLSTFLIFSNRHKKKNLLIGSTLVMGFAMFVQFGTSLLCQDFHDICPFMTMTAVSVYVVAFSIGLGPIPYIVVQEMFGPEDQGAVFTLSIAMNWGVNFLLLTLFMIVHMQIKSYTYLLFLCVILVILLYIVFLVPDTNTLQGSNSTETGFLTINNENQDNNTEEESSL